MKTTTVSKIASLVISAVIIQTAIAGHDEGIGVGPAPGGGGSGDGILEMLFGSRGFLSTPASGGDAHKGFPARHSATGTFDNENGQEQSSDVTQRAASK